MMHQPVHGLPSIFSIGDLEALGDDGNVEWDMDGALLESCCSPFATEVKHCMVPQPSEYDGAPHWPPHLLTARSLPKLHVGSDPLGTCRSPRHIAFPLDVGYTRAYSLTGVVTAHCNRVPDLLRCCVEALFAEL